MYDILQLNDMLVPELRELADSLGVDGFKKLNKQELVYTILDHQALKGEKKKSSNGSGADLPDEVPVSSDNMRVDKRQPGAIKKRTRKPGAGNPRETEEVAEEEIESTPAPAVEKTEFQKTDRPQQPRRPEHRRPEHRDQRGGQTREPRPNQENREPREIREPRENREPREVREPRENREPREVREPRENRQQESRQPETRQPLPPIERQPSQQPIDPRAQQQRDARDIQREARERF